jgi:hypothetical protein
MASASHASRCTARQLRLKVLAIVTAVWILTTSRTTAQVIVGFGLNNKGGGVAN